MNAIELRIGNFIRVCEITETTKSGTVSLIRPEETILITKDNICSIIKFSDSYKPIPLTEEWLLRLNAPKFLVGFELMTHGRIRYANDYGETLNADYVHDLQNLYFYITGNELSC